jgi:hypothetical protein
LQYQHQEQSDETENVGNTEAGADYDSSVRRGRDSHRGSGDMAYFRGPQSSLSPSQRRIL